MSNSNEVIVIIQKWLMESYDPRNDGWVQKHYKDKVKEVLDYLKINDRVKKFNKENKIKEL
tara:strand:+ start:658 stop:840 length:183 start_codon:yes stop_codon:yes gene_type:complete